jgi:formiminotetrahydrofolate cyclodeaminase
MDAGRSISAVTGVKIYKEFIKIAAGGGGISAISKESGASLPRLLLDFGRRCRQFRRWERAEDFAQKKLS